MDVIAERAFERLQLLSAISDEEGALTREFMGPAMALATETLAGWMREAGLIVDRDGWGNVFGRSAPADDPRPLLVVGSHLDTVRNAGKFDGAMGVIAALANAEHFSPDDFQKLPFVFEVAAFSDEEGVRFHTTYLGSRAAVGAIDDDDLTRADRQGVRLSELVEKHWHRPAPRYKPGKVIAYLEAHIEQGPVLEQEGLAVGVVAGIAGQCRIALTFEGRAAHAGTCPMDMRQDALAGAAEFILATERAALNEPGLVATVGCIEVPGSASNVIPGRSILSLDVRHLDDAIRAKTLLELSGSAREIADRRHLQLIWEVIQESKAVQCDSVLCETLSACVSQRLGRALTLRGGAGHDAVVLSRVAPIGMLFVRCAGGISHHPEESIEPGDLALVIAVLKDAVIALAKKSA